MVRFHIQTDSDIPASVQLYNQIQFAIASRKYPPGHKLPSTRQLAAETGLHRNTISKIYRQMEEEGTVDAHAGSGIYVRAQRDNQVTPSSPIAQRYPQARQLVRHSLDALLEQGCSLSEARNVFLAEIDWRLRCSAKVLVTAPLQDIGAGHLMTQQLQEALHIPVQLVPLEELSQVLEQTQSGTVVTSRYFISEAQAIATPRSVRVIPIDIYDYSKEMQQVLQLRDASCLGLVSLSSGFLRAAEVIVHSLRGETLLVMTTQPEDDYKLRAIVRCANTIACFDQNSFAVVKQAIVAAREDLIRPPALIACDDYISQESIQVLKRELGFS